MNNKDIKPCSFCGKPLLKQDGKTYLNVYRIKVSWLLADAQAINKHIGLTIQLGSEALASVMGTNEEMIKEFATKEFLICFPCYSKLGIPDES